MAFAPKMWLFFSLKVSWVDVIKGAYIFSFCGMSSLQTATINMSSKQTLWSSKLLSAGEEQIWPGCNGIGITGRWPGNPALSSSRQQLGIFTLCWIWRVAGSSCPAPAQADMANLRTAQHFELQWGMRGAPEAKNVILIGTGKSCIRICALLILNSNTFVAVCAECELLKTLLCYQQGEKMNY